jgi:hypothetical protein
MSLAPFAYADKAQVRRHGPCGYDDYGKYKPWLRDEFGFRCVYCLERESWYPDRSASFSIDHVIPQSRDPALICVYENLLYACTRCNSARREKPILDPTVAAMGEHLRLGPDAVLIGDARKGRELIRLLGLNEPQIVEVRRRFLDLITLRERYPGDLEIARMFAWAFGFPDDMPDLRTRRPPGGNARTPSEDDCHFARRERGELPPVY